MKTETELREYLKGKKVLYIATKNQDYIRVTQEINLLKAECDFYDIIVFNDKSYLTRFIKTFLKFLFTNIKEYDVIFIGFMAQMICVPFFWKLKKREVITDLFISVYDTLVDDRKKFTPNSILAKVFRWIDSFTIKQSNYIITDTKAHAKYFCYEFKAKQEEIFVYYLEADVSLYYPREVEKPLEYTDKFIVLYFGSILPVQGVNIVLDTIKKLQQEKTIHFIIIGPIGDKVEKIESNTVTYIDWLKQEELADYIAFSDLCLAGHFSNTVGKANRTIPGKVYIYQAMNKKIVLGKSEANQELFSLNDKNIYWVERGTAEELAQCILHVREKSEYE